MIARTKVRFGLIGAGAIAQAYVQAFAQCDTAELVGVADLRGDAAAQAAEQAGCDAFTSYTALCSEMQPDAVVICTPPITHPPISLNVMEQGIHVLCEKPFAIDSLGARTMIEASRTNSVKLSMASKFRDVADLQQARQLINDGAIGRVQLFENAFTGKVDMSNRWNSNPEISGGGVLIDNGTHSVDIVRYVFGPISEILVIEGERYQHFEVEDTVHVFLRTHGGAMGEIDLTWSLNKPLPAFLTVYGTEGMLQVGWRESKFRRNGDGDWTVFGNGYDKVAAFRGQIENFADSLLTGETMIVTPDDALASVDVIEAGYASLCSGSWQPVRYSGRAPRLFVPDGDVTACELAESQA